jgi:hypothetical protein
MAQHSLPDREPVTDEEQQIIAEFCDWLEKPESGMRVYYTGDLATDALFHNFPEAVRSLAWAAMEKGRVRLFQRRKQFAVFEYVVMKRGNALVVPQA